MKNVKNYDLNETKEQNEIPELIDTNIKIGCVPFIFLFICCCFIAYLLFLIKNFLINTL
jgi:hypothetical protein